MLTPVALPPRITQARNETERNGIGPNCEYDRNCRGRSLGGECRRGAASDDQRDSFGYQFSGKRRQSLIVAVGPAEVDLDVLTLQIAGLFKRGAKDIREIHERGSWPNPELSHPITGIACGWARAASGQEAAPPSTLMKSRRLTAPPQRRFKAYQKEPNCASRQIYPLLQWVIRVAIG